MEMTTRIMECKFEVEERDRDVFIEARDIIKDLLEEVGIADNLEVASEFIIAKKDRTRTVFCEDDLPIFLEMLESLASASDVIVKTLE